MRHIYSIPPSPRWLTPLRIPTAELPWKIRRWLLDGVSTSALITRAGGKAPEIRLFHQQWTLPDPGERPLLAVSSRRRVMIREVSIHCAGEPWMLARTAVSNQIPKTLLHALKNLHARPIGELLFNTPGIRRSPFEISRLYGGYPPLSAHLHWDSTVWGRRSQFFCGNACLLLSECFLPGFQHWLENTYSA